MKRPDGKIVGTSTLYIPLRELDVATALLLLYQVNLPCLNAPVPQLTVTHAIIPAGQVLERLNGRSVSKVFNDGKWADIGYIRDLMLEVGCV